LDAICLITAPRTGTNHLCEVLRNFTEMAPYREVFESDGAHGIDSQTWPLLRRLTGVDFVSHKDPRLVAFTHEKPGAWADALEQAALSLNKRVMSFKLFRHSLPVELVEQQIMPRSGLRAIFVVRKQVDSYISWRKAVELGIWQGADTTGMRLTLDADKFEQWLILQEQWYRHWKAYLERRFMPVPVLRYESDIDQPPERALKRFAAAAAQVGITLRPPTTLTHAGLERQDRARALADKVRNWAEFSREIFARGLERRAFGYPL
jgi:LPS sulfotransferase NodH